MLGWVLFSEKDLFLRFTMSAVGAVEKTPYALGGALTDFTAVSPQISEKLFLILRKKFVADVSSRIDTPTIKTGDGSVSWLFLSHFSNRP